MAKTMYSISLRLGLSADAKVLKDIGHAASKQEAESAAFAFIHDKKNLEDLGCESFYSRIITYSDGTVGIDYGSHSRFVVIVPIG